MAGKIDSCTLGMTNVSITEKSPAWRPPDTLDCTAATSPRTITMYLPEQMDRGEHEVPRPRPSAWRRPLRSRRRCCPVQSVRWSSWPYPHASISTNLSVTSNHGPGDAGVDVDAQVLLAHPGDNVPQSLPCRPAFDDRRGRLAHVLRELDAHPPGMVARRRRTASRFRSASIFSRRRSCDSGTRRYSFMGCTDRFVC